MLLDEVPGSGWLNAPLFWTLENNEHTHKGELVHVPFSYVFVIRPWTQTMLYKVCIYTASPYYERFVPVHRFRFQSSHHSVC